MDIKAKFKSPIILPASCKPRKVYHTRYISYFINIFEACGVEYELKGTDKDTVFYTEINEKKVLFDYSDYHRIVKNRPKDIPCFKYHYSYRTSKKQKNIFPFTPTSFINWPRYFELSKSIQYSAKGNLIINKQKPYGNAIERREKVLGMLKEKYSGSLSTKPDDSQEDFWRMINKCLVAVFVPGATNDMLDRGHLQYLAFGCCTIAPPIVDRLPYGKRMLPGVHYIQCASDYSDLIEKIDWCREHRDICRKIGRYAKKLFLKTSTPAKLLEWLLICTGDC